MNVFSKPTIPKENTITYMDYFKKNIDLAKYKIPELKTIAKYNRLHISGTKKVLIQRIETCFKHAKYAILIQAKYRGHLVKRLFRLHGPAFNNIKSCVNDSDFFTLDPLDEIGLYHFFSYKDEKGFTYGFHIQSLINMFQKGGGGKNPYTRTSFPDEIIQNILAFNRLSRIILSSQPKIKPTINNRTTATPSMELENRFIPRSESSQQQQPNFINTRNQTLEKLADLRTKDINTRIREIFMEIDLLGNYTQSAWFSNLNMYSYIRFIQSLYSIWSHRANMSLHVRSQICPYYNPFNYQIDTSEIFIAYNMNLTNLRTAALTIIENIVFSGGDIEFRKIGIMHILTALTMVSIPARESLPWLYESVVL